MLALPSFPPAFQLVAVDCEVAAFARAVGAAPRGIEDGTIFWAARDDLLDMALVLEPETPAAVESVYLLAVAACDALARLVAPDASVACAWPGDLLLGGARVGGLRAAIAPTADTTAPPPWLVFGLCLQLAEVAGEAPDRTSLARHGAGAVGAAALLDTISRRFLHWAGRQRTDGPASIDAAWNGRCHRRGEQGVLVLGGKRIAGTIHGVDGGGRFAIGQHRLSLTDALGLLA